MPAPMPFDAPVTTATLPASFDIKNIPFFFLGGGRNGALVPWFRNMELLNCPSRSPRSFVMRPLFHPSPDDLRVEAILHALSDPERAVIFAEIAGAECVQRCSVLANMGDR